MFFKLITWLIICLKFIIILGDPNDLDIWMLDMQPYKSGVMILAASVNMQSSARLHYAFGKLNMECDNFLCNR